MSCGEKSKELKNDLKNTKNVLEAAVEVANDGENMKKNIQDLRTKTPLTKDQWQTWLPETLLDMPMTFSQINFMPGIGSCGAFYKVGNKRIRVMVIDGAGKRGAGVVGPYRMSNKIEYNEEGIWGATKTIEIDGHKAKLSSLKSGKNSISMFYDNRFAVDIETNEVEEHDALYKIFRKLNLEQLNNL